MQLRAHHIVLQETEVAREAEVRMACSLDGKIYLSVSEPSRCKYVVLLRAPSLCTGITREPELQGSQRAVPVEKQEL